MTLQEVHVVSLDSMATVPLAAVISMTAGPIFGAAPEMRPGRSSMVTLVLYFWPVFFEHVGRQLWFWGSAWLSRWKKPQPGLFGVHLGRLSRPGSRCQSVSGQRWDSHRFHHFAETF